MCVLVLPTPTRQLVMRRWRDRCGEGGCLCGTESTCTNENQCVNEKCMCNTQSGCTGETQCYWDDSACLDCMEGEVSKNKKCSCTGNKNSAACNQSVATSCGESGCLCGTDPSCTNENQCVDNKCMCNTTSSCTGTKLCDWDNSRCLTCKDGEVLKNNACSCTGNTNGKKCDSSADTCTESGCMCGTDPICTNKNRCDNGDCKCNETDGCSGSSTCDWDTSQCLDCLEGEVIEDGNCSCALNEDQQPCDHTVADSCGESGCLCGTGPVCANENQCVDNKCMCNTRAGCTGTKLCDWDNSRCLTCKDGEVLKNNACSCTGNTDGKKCDSSADTCTESGCMCGTDPICTNQNRCDNGECSCNEADGCSGTSTCDWDTSQCLDCLEGEVIEDGNCSCALNEDQQPCDHTVADSCGESGCLCGTGSGCTNDNQCVNEKCICNTQSGCVGDTQCYWDDSACLDCMEGEVSKNKKCSCPGNENSAACNQSVATSCGESGCLCGTDPSCTNENQCVDNKCMCNTTSSCTGTKLCDWNNSRCLTCKDGEVLKNNACSCAGNTDGKQCDSSADTCTKSGCMCGTDPICTNKNRCDNGECMCNEADACTGASTCDWDTSQCLDCLEGEVMEDGNCLCTTNDDDQPCDHTVADSCGESGCLCGIGPVCANENQCVDNKCTCNTRSSCADTKLCDWDNSRCLTCKDGEVLKNNACSCTGNTNGKKCDSSADTCTESGCMCGTGPICTNQNRCDNGECSCNEADGCSGTSTCDWDTSQCLDCLEGEVGKDGNCSCALNDDEQPCDHLLADSCTNQGCMCGSETACGEGFQCTNGQCVCINDSACGNYNRCINGKCKCHTLAEGCTYQPNCHTFSHWYYPCTNMRYFSTPRHPYKLDIGCYPNRTVLCRHN